MSKNQDKHTNKIALKTLDKLHIVKVDLRFLANLKSVWDVEQSSPTYNDMHAISRLCISIESQIKKCEKSISSLIKKDANL